VSEIILDESWTNLSELEERDIDVIQVIHIEALTYFTFEGLKRRLKIHPETLSRILTRLTEDEILEKTDNGYSLTTKGKQLLKQQTQRANPTRVPVLQSFIPPELSVDKIASDLKGKWFGSLRWLGYSVSEETVELKWITTNGEVVVSAVLTDGMLQIYSKEVTENDFSTTLSVAYQLMGYITKLITKAENN
jgi:DNA-binding Lrp family transcriptional regulator